MVKMTEQRVVLYALPHKIKGFVVADEYGDTTIVLNSALTREANEATYLHELEHIKNNDLYREDDVQVIESERHKE